MLLMMMVVMIDFICSIHLLTQQPKGYYKMSDNKDKSNKDD
jgi:hypothetical protein